MATIKSYTDLEQSKKLAEILPPESADMFYDNGVSKPFVLDSLSIKSVRHTYPCWSLAALINILPPIEGFRPIIDLDINLIRYEGNYRDELCFNGNNLVDACVAMIEKLHELKLV